MKIIDPFWFLLALAIGIFFTYIFESEYKTVIKYPHPGKNITYKDYDNMCYKYIPTEVKCPSNSKNINEFKIQH